MATDLFISVDQGTTSTRGLLFNSKGECLFTHQLPVTQYRPKPGYTEHDPVEIINGVKKCIEECVAFADSPIKGTFRCVVGIAIGLTNQRETTIAWDRLTGEPLYNAVVWLDTRTSHIVDNLIDVHKDKNAFLVKKIIEFYFENNRNAYFNNVPKVKEAAKKGTLCFGTVDSWMFYKLLGRHITDVSNASRYFLMNLSTCSWDSELCQTFGINREYLPEIVSSSELYGYYKTNNGQRIPIAGCLGDQQAALVGHQCFSIGSLKNTYGTGCFLLANTGNVPVFSGKGLVATVAYKLGPQEPVVYAIEGSIAIAGAGINWLKQNLKIIESEDDFNNACSETPSTEGVYFVPAFSGLFAPYWALEAKGKHIIRALMESFAYQARDVKQFKKSEKIVEVIKDEMNYDKIHFKVDGGVSNSDVCVQFQSDILGTTVERPKMRESTGLGAAIAAGLGVGFWKNLTQVSNSINPDIQVFTPKMSQEGSL
ncbi:actin-like ATPase domain-containing protein [Rozella allomycis CSF55]|uniref:Actin-like ATPase domain-containing protein n=1 Tax=Rozella allomycis (strain CSF55) TaxID=988480 RepID=A0A4P9YIL9_ROZAC|nr:actin-like ATPase domain-containing protein [Rozella allomycis CSF55]